MVATAVLALFLAFFAYPARRQRMAALWVENQGGTLSFRDEFALPEGIDPLSVGTGSIWVRERPVPDWVLSVFDLHYFWDVTEVDLSGRHLTSIDALANLPELEWLDVRETDLTDAQIEQLRVALPKCEILSGAHEMSADPFVR
ncbi:MAG: hypothetical protein AAGI63_19420 [Planctomycetota bacterium]